MNQDTIRQFSRGIYPASDIPMALYLSDPCPVPSLSSGAANTIITRSPQHVWSEHPRFGGRIEDDSNASDMGTLMHDLLLGGEGKIRVIEPSDYRSKPTKDNPDGAIPIGWTNGAIRAARDQARANGLTPVLAGAIAGARTARAVALAFLQQSELAGAIDVGESEVTMLWTEGDTWFRARPDWMNHDQRICLHYKTTLASAAPDPLSRMVVNMGYDVSLAFYRRGWEALTGAKDWMHVILAQEQTKPYACSLIGLDPAAWAIADQKVNLAVALWRHAMETDQWSAYSGRIHYVSPTAWQLAEAEAMRQDEAREVAL